MNTGTWIAVGIGIGAAVFAATNEPVWIAVGVAVGSALVGKNQKIKMKIRGRVYSTPLRWNRFNKGSYHR